MQQWPTDFICQLISEAELRGESGAVLSSPREAALFRFAINNTKRRKGIGQGLTTVINGSEVQIRRRPIVKKNGEDES